MASEPLVQEPVAICWDGNGRMYVAEMRSYMKDLQGTGERLPICRLTRLENTYGDGKMGKSSVFIDSTSKLAPALSGAALVKGNEDVLIRALLQGLKGPGLFFRRM